MIILLLLVRTTYTWVLFFAHIPFVVNHTFNANGEVATTFPLFLQWTAPIAHSFCEVCNWHDLHILVTAPFCCDRKARAACAQSFTLWQQATIEITCHDHSIIACSRHAHMGVVLRLHLVRGESHIQRNGQFSLSLLYARISAILHEFVCWGTTIWIIGSALYNA